jgi:hypothetical protein
MGPIIAAIYINSADGEYNACSPRTIAKDQFDAS